MKIRNSALKLAILISSLHCILGNVIGARSDNTFIGIIFLPYSFIGGLSDFAGWGSLSLILELAGLISMALFFYILVIFVKRTNVQD